MSLTTKGPDASIRPNQIFAVSLDYTMLDKEKSQQVVEVVNRELVTPYGLRTLSLDDPKFVGKCYGRQSKQRHALIIMARFGLGFWDHMLRLT